METEQNNFSDGFPCICVKSEGRKRPGRSFKEVPKRNQETNNFSKRIPSSMALIFLAVWLHFILRRGGFGGVCRFDIEASEVHLRIREEGNDKLKRYVVVDCIGCWILLPIDAWNKLWKCIFTMRIMQNNSRLQILQLCKFCACRIWLGHNVSIWRGSGKGTRRKGVEGTQTRSSRILKCNCMSLVSLWKYIHSTASRKSYEIFANVLGPTIIYLGINICLLSGFLGYIFPNHDVKWPHDCPMEVLWLDEVPLLTKPGPFLSALAELMASWCPKIRHQLVPPPPELSDECEKWSFWSKRWGRWGQLKKPLGWRG